MAEGIVEFNDWSKLDLRVGKIINVEDIEGADKLYKLTIDLGSEIGKRIICSGLKEYYKHEELQDKIVSVFVNLAPKKMRGVMSEGMILAACTPDESEVVLVTPEKDIAIGNRIY